MALKNRCSQLSTTIIIAIAGGLAELTLAIALPTERAIAQIIPDNTLGAENSAIAPKDKKDPHLTLIEGGAIRGSNLFHSFSHFNVNQESLVYFANPTGIDNIITRVTGNSHSKIFGTLGVNGTANLFLINPNGIIFGSNARLDIRGSFFATTADSLIFQDGSKFSATNPNAPPLLTINVTPGLQYPNPATSAIANSGNLSAKQNLTLAAANLNLSGKLAAGGNLTLQALDTIRIRDSISHPFIAAAGGNLLVQGDRAVDIFALNHRDSSFYSGKDTTFRSANPVIGDAHYSTGRNFRIEQLNGSLGTLESPNDPIIRSQGDVSFYGYRGTSLHIIAGGSVNINTIIITGAETGTLGVDFIQENIITSDGQTISIDGSSRPTLDVRAGVNLTAIGTPGVTGYNFPTDIFFDSALTPVATPSTAASATNADINIGRIQSNAANSQVFLTTQYQPNTTLSGGSITVNNTGLSGGGIDTSSGSGNGGSIVIDSRSNINIIGNINTGSSSGNSGSITLIAQKDITTTSNIFSFSNTGKAGSITLNAGNSGTINIKNVGQVNAATSSYGQAGNIKVIAGQLNIQNDLGQTKLGVNGTVTINTRSAPNLNPLPDKLVNSQLNLNCNPNLAANNSNSNSQFVNTGTGGSPSNPGGILNNYSVQAPWIDLSTPEPINSNTAEASPNSSQPIVEAQGFSRNSQGEILLSVCTASP
jgi:filamentous hemagglutinin family protein